MLDFRPSAPPDVDLLDIAIPMDDETDHDVDEGRGATCSTCEDLLPLGETGPECGDCVEARAFEGAF